MDSAYLNFSVTDLTDDITGGYLAGTTFSASGPNFSRADEMLELCSECGDPTSEILYSDIESAADYGVSYYETNGSAVAYGPITSGSGYAPPFLLYANE